MKLPVAIPLTDGMDEVNATTDHHTVHYANDGVLRQSPETSSQHSVQLTIPVKYDNSMSGYIVKRDPSSTIATESNDLLDTLSTCPRDSSGKFDRKWRFARLTTGENYTVARPNFVKRCSPNQQGSDKNAIVEVSKPAVSEINTKAKSIHETLNALIAKSERIQPNMKVDHHTLLVPVTVNHLNTADTRTQKEHGTMQDKSEIKNKSQSSKVVSPHNSSPRRIRDMFPNWGQVLDNKLPEADKSKAAHADGTKQRSLMLDRRFKEFCVNKNTKHNVNSPDKLSENDEDIFNEVLLGGSTKIAKAKEETVTTPEDCTVKPAQSQTTEVSPINACTSDSANRVTNNLDDCINRVAAGEGIIRQRFTPKYKTRKKIKTKTNKTSVGMTSKRKLFGQSENSEAAKICKMNDRTEHGTSAKTCQSRDHTDDVHIYQKKEQAELDSHYLLQKPDNVHPSVKTVFDSDKHCVGLLQSANMTTVQNHHLLQPLGQEEPTSFHIKQNMQVLPKHDRFILPKQTTALSTCNRTESYVGPQTNYELDLKSGTDAVSNNAHSVPTQGLENWSSNAKTSQYKNERRRSGIVETQPSSSTRSSPLSVGDMNECDGERTSDASKHQITDANDRTANTRGAVTDTGRSSANNGTEEYKPFQSQVQKPLNQAASNYKCLQEAQKYTKSDLITLKPANVKLERLNVPIDRPVLVGNVRVFGESASKNNSVGQVFHSKQNESQCSKLMEAAQTVTAGRSLLHNNRPNTEHSYDKGHNPLTKFYYVIDRKSLTKNEQNADNSKQINGQESHTTALKQDEITTGVNSPKPITAEVYRYLMSKSNIASSLQAENITTSVGNTNSIGDTSEQDDANVVANTSMQAVNVKKELNQLQTSVGVSKPAYKARLLTVAEMLKLRRCDETAKTAHSPLRIYGQAKNHCGGGIQYGNYSNMQNVRQDDSNQELSTYRNIPDTLTSLKSSHSSSERVDTQAQLSKTHRNSLNNDSPKRVLSQNATDGVGVSLLNNPNQLSNPTSSYGQPSYSLKIGDKMFVVKQVAASLLPAKNVPTVNQEKREKTTLPAPKPKVDVKSSAKKHTPKKRKVQQGKKKSDKSVLRLRRKIMKLLKNSEDPFERLIFTLGLMPKDKQVQYLDGMTPNRRQITLSPVPSAKHDNSDEPEVIRAASSKRAETVQILKNDLGHVTYETHLIQINIVTDKQRELHRWHKFSDYPCTVHLTDRNAIAEIDAESLKQGFFLVHFCRRSSKPSAKSSGLECPAILSQYPPSVAALPLDSIGLAIGHPFPDDSSARYKLDCVNQHSDDVHKVIGLVLGSKQLKQSHAVTDNRYASVVDNSMSPRYQSAKFYSDGMREYFTTGSDSKVTEENAQQERKRAEAAKAIEMLQSRSTVQLSKYSAKAMALKIKQNELFESCKMLKRDKSSREAPSRPMEESDNEEAQSSYMWTNE